MTTRAIHPLQWLWTCALVLAAGAAFAAPADPVALGDRIYRLGEDATRRPLQAVYGSGTKASGAAVACIACHRGSGLGGVEGDVTIPPITGRALFATGEPVVVRVDRRTGPGLTVAHGAYDEAAFTRIVRTGRDPAGRELNSLMPRYSLSAAELRAVSAYLRTLSTGPSPGVGPDELHFATVIAPGVAPERREAFLRTLNAVVAQANMTVHTSQRQKLAITERRLGGRRHWTLDVWELAGSPDTWRAQLESRQEAHPVFAVLSGLGGDSWQPVHDFCEEHHVGCWFPSIDVLPKRAEQGAFGLYFAGGVGAEAAVIARAIAPPARGRVVQVLGGDVRAAVAAGALRDRVAGDRLVQIALADPTLPAMLASLQPDDALVLWLTTPEFAQLPTTAPSNRVYASALLVGGEDGVPPAWRTNTVLAQQQEKPALRAANVERLRAWLGGMHIPVVDLRMQSEVYFAARYLLATTHAMLNNVHAPYLIERGEGMLSSYEAMLVRDEVQSLMMAPMNKRPGGGATTGTDAGVASSARAHLDEMATRGGTTVYPRLSLANGQRIAAKGAYLERLDPAGAGVIGDPEWVVP
jgi:mono/diheme cytochrome c family protein